MNAAYDAKQQKGTGLKILTPKQILKRLPIALAQISASNNSESLLNEIMQIIPETLKYWVGVQQGQSYLMGRRCLFNLGWPPF